MNTNVEGISVNNAPQNGLMLAYYRKKIIFEKYNKEQLSAKILTTHQEYGELLEMHLFDENKEWRVVKSASGYIGPILIEDMDGVDAVCEEMYVERGKYSNVPDTIKVINYLEEKENGMLQVSNFRLAVPEGEV